MEPKKLTREQMINLAKQCNAHLEITNAHLGIAIAKCKLDVLEKEEKELELRNS